MEKLAQLVVSGPGEAEAFETVEAAHRCCRRPELQTAITLDAQALGDERDRDGRKPSCHDRPDINCCRPLACGCQEAEIGLARSDRAGLERLEAGLVQMEEPVIAGQLGLRLVAGGRTEDRPEGLGVMPINILHSLEGGDVLSDLADGQLMEGLDLVRAGHADEDNTPFRMSRLWLHNRLFCREIKDLCETLFTHKPDTPHHVARADLLVQP